MSTIVEGTRDHTAPSGEPSDGLARGTTLGRYVILSLVGRGAVGEVYAAYDPELDRKVAVKVLRVRAVRDATKLVARLQREAKAMARVSHPNVIAVHDAGVSEGRAFLTMEFLRGTTLERWQKLRPRDWREVCAVYRAAGRGLAAAHAVGLVHRDFKPTNVLVNHDASVVKVTDFGIARALDADDGQPGDAMTETGAILGTPSYMSPEQFRSEPTDARADQFSFCAALYEALYDVRPHAGDTFEALAESVLAGRVTEAPKGTKVPVRIRQALLRGLAVDPANRFASLEDLLAALSRHPAVERRRAVVVATVVVTVAAVVLFHRGFARGPSPPPPCAGGETAVQEVWNGAAATAGEHAFRATGAVFADDAWRHTRDALDDYGRRWAVAHHQTCAATRVRGEQSEQVMTLRMVCLERRRSQLRELVRLFEEADRGVVEKSVSAVAALPSIDVCDDVTSLSEVRPPPGDKAMADEIARLRDELSGIRAQYEAGLRKPALERLKGLEPRVRATGYEPLLAELLWVLGALQNTMGNWQASADTLREATWTAERARDDETKAEAEVGMVVANTNLGRLDEAALWSDAAAATLARHGSDQLLEAAWNLAVAILRNGQERFDESIAHAQRAVALAERHASTNPSLLMRSYVQLGRALTRGTGSAEGLPYLERAEETIVKSYGPLHPFRATAASFRVGVLLLLERYDDAVAAARAVLPMAVQALPMDNPQLGSMLANYADALARSGHYEEALDVIDRVLETSAAGRDDRLRSSVLTVRAYAYTRTGRCAEGVAAADEALRALATNDLPSDHEAWAEPHLARAEALLCAGDAQKALPAAQRAFAIFGRVPRHEPLMQHMMADAEQAVARARAARGP